MSVDIIQQERKHENRIQCFSSIRCTKSNGPVRILTHGWKPTFDAVIVQHILQLVWVLDKGDVESVMIPFVDAVVFVAIS